jgi:hypothetical protein
LRIARQGSASVFSARVTSGAVMKQLTGHFNLNRASGNCRAAPVS